MWPKIDRARRRLSSGASAPPAVEVADDAPIADEVGGVEDVVIILGSLEVDRLRAALELLLGAAIERPDTPFRMERALSLVLTGRGVPGRPRVLRRPAGLSTPESWEIHLDGVDRATGAAVLAAGRTGVLAS